MTSKAGHRAPRGFTLVELMVVVAIIGLLASVAIPNFTRATLRSRSAERLTVMMAIAAGVNDTVMQAQGVPGGTFVGAANPPGVPNSGKRKFDWTMTGWRQLPMVVMGDSYYSYTFLAEDAGGNGGVTMTVTATGDLDGDGTQSSKVMGYQGVGYSFELTSEVPARGEEDQATF